MSRILSVCCEAKFDCLMAVDYGGFKPKCNALEDTYFKNGCPFYKKIDKNSAINYHQFLDKEAREYYDKNMPQE